jgi:Methyltransferase domain
MDQTKVARRVLTDLQPESVLEVGWGTGMLVEQLRELDVDAGVLDASENAIAGAVAPLDRKYDLVLCIDVLEHVPALDAEETIENLCAATDRILFSSSPSGYAEPTNVNVQPLEVWSAHFARQGFIRKLDFDASFVTPWAALYERSHALLPNVVRTYDREWWRLRSEVRDVREKVLELHARFEEGSGTVAEQNVRLRGDLLAARDQLVGHEARLGEALGKIELLEHELRRHQDALADAQRLLSSRTGRLLRAWHRLRALLR